MSKKLINISVDVMAKDMVQYPYDIVIWVNIAEIINIMQILQDDIAIVILQYIAILIHRNVILAAPQ